MLKPDTELHITNAPSLWIHLDFCPKRDDLFKTTLVGSQCDRYDFRLAAKVTSRVSAFQLYAVYHYFLSMSSINPPCCPALCASVKFERLFSIQSIQTARDISMIYTKYNFDDNHPCESFKKFIALFKNELDRYHNDELCHKPSLIDYLYIFGWHDSKTKFYCSTVTNNVELKVMLQFNLGIGVQNI